MSDFTIKFNLLIEIEEAANRRSYPITLLKYDGKRSFNRDGARFSSLRLIVDQYDYELYFDQYNRDKFHDLYEVDGENSKLPYFKDMIFEDESMFILSDEYNIVKFIKLLEISDLEQFLLELRED